MTLSTSEAGKALADARPKKTIHCAVCGKEFVTVGHGKYCSNACKQRAKYYRNKAKK